MHAGPRETQNLGDLTTKFDDRPMLRGAWSIATKISFPAPRLHETLTFGATGAGGWLARTRRQRSPQRGEVRARSRSFASCATGRGASRMRALPVFNLPPRRFPC